MSDTRYPGHGPWDEVWFLEGRTREGAGFWFRGTLSDGVRRQAEAWAVWDAPEGPVRSWAALPLGEVRTGSQRLLHPDLALTGSRFRGRTPRIAWDLSLQATVPAVPMVPTVLERLGVGRTYEPVLPAAQVRGTVTVDGVAHAVEGSGVLGHLFGARSRVAAWGWCHAHDLAHDPPVVVEVLAARLGTSARALPPLTSVVVRWGDETLALTSLIDLGRTRSVLGADAWRVRARRRGLALDVEVDLGATEHRTVARYEDPEGAPTWCTNTSRGGLRLRLARGRQVHTWETDRASAELAGRVRPAGPVTLPPST